LKNQARIIAKAALVKRRNSAVLHIEAFPEQTENFSWNNLANLTNEIGTVDYTLPLPGGDGQRFYRVIAP
jgi:hypothetical protein